MWVILTCIAYIRFGFRAFFLLLLFHWWFFFLPLGQHDCVTVINNFFPRERLDYYTKPQGLDKEPKLPVKLAGPLHKIITTTNMHPVKVE